MRARRSCNPLFFFDRTLDGALLCGTVAVTADVTRSGSRSSGTAGRGFLTGTGSLAGLIATFAGGPGAGEAAVVRSVAVSTAPSGLQDAMLRATVASDCTFGRLRRSLALGKYGRAVSSSSCSVRYEHTPHWVCTDRPADLAVPRPLLNFVWPEGLRRTRTGLEPSCKKWPQRTQCPGNSAGSARASDPEAWPAAVLCRCRVRSTCVAASTGEKDRKCGKASWCSAVTAVGSCAAMARWKAREEDVQWTGVGSVLPACSVFFAKLMHVRGRSGSGETPVRTRTGRIASVIGSRERPRWVVLNRAQSFFFFLMSSLEMTMAEGDLACTVAQSALEPQWLGGEARLQPGHWQTS